jgi:hypothetical protein
MTRWRNKKTGKVWTQQDGLTWFPPGWTTDHDEIVENEGVMSAEGMHLGDQRPVIKKPCEGRLVLVEPRSGTQCGLEWGHAGSHRFRDTEWSACAQSCGHVWCGEKCGSPQAVVMPIGDQRDTGRLCEHGFSFCIDCAAEVRRGLLNAIRMIDREYATCGTTPGGCPRPRGHRGEHGICATSDWRKKPND